MTHKESEDFCFWVSQLEGMIKGYVRMIDLVNLKNNMEERMGHMEEGMGHKKEIMGHRKEIMGHVGHKIEENMQRLVKLIQNIEIKLPKGDDVDHGT